MMLRKLNPPYWLYRLYAEIASRLTVDQDRRPIPPACCEICGGPHTEQLCPNAKRMGLK
jgi:hypothetical protein